jgi:hypothetical protein
LLAADDAERNNTCPVCGGWPTCYREAPHRCNECDLPVVHWQPWREMQTKIEQLTAERDYAITWVTYTHSAAERPTPADILTVFRSALTQQPSIESVIEELRGET